MLIVNYLGVPICTSFPLDKSQHKSCASSIEGAVPGGEGGERERVAIGHDVRGVVAEMEERRRGIAER